METGNMSGVKRQLKRTQDKAQGVNKKHATYERVTCDLLHAKRVRAEGVLVGLESGGPQAHIVASENTVQIALQMPDGTLKGGLLFARNGVVGLEIVNPNVAADTPRFLFGWQNNTPALLWTTSTGEKLFCFDPATGTFRETPPSATGNTESA
jgi:hypothetical protein